MPARFTLRLTIAIFLVGHFQLLPATFDENGNGLTFALDGTTYQGVASALVDEWQFEGFNAWLEAKVPFHSRLHSILFGTLGRLAGHNILAVEPLNLFFYLGILTCIYFLGREIFNHRAGLLAASIVALWPSFLLHSTQLMRDSMAILCFLALMLVLTLLLTREFNWRKRNFARWRRCDRGGVVLDHARKHVERSTRRHCDRDCDVVSANGSSKEFHEWKRDRVALDADCRTPGPVASSKLDAPRQ